MALSEPHAQTSDACLTALKSRPEGLTTAEATRRLAEHGPNQLAEAQGRKPFWRFLAQFHNVLIYVLMVAAMVTGALQHIITVSSAG